jgi:hypothetical protein
MGDESGWYEWVSGVAERICILCVVGTRSSWHSWFLAVSPVSGCNMMAIVCCLGCTLTTSTTITPFSDFAFAEDRKIGFWSAQQYCDYLRVCFLRSEVLKVEVVRSFGGWGSSYVWMWWKCCLGGGSPSHTLT